METYKLGEMEEKFANLIWDHAPIPSGQLVKLCEEAFHWKRTTSSIDAKTERLVQQGLNALLKGRTSFIIAHRLSTIKNCDRILYIADKGIAEMGTHQQLLEKQGKYYHLYTAQVEE